MARVGKAKAAQVGDFLFRYTLARYRCVGGPLSSGRIRLAAEIRQGVHVFEGAIVIDADARPPVTTDREHHSFFVAIMNGDDGAIPEIEPAELAEWRDYVLNKGPLPKRREPVTVGSAVPADGMARKGLIFGWISGLTNWLPRRWRNVTDRSPPR